MAIEFRDFESHLQKVEDHGHYLMGLCVFHDDSSPSLMVFKDGWFRCLACNKNGRWKQLWNKLQGQNVVIRSETNTQWRGPEIRAFHTVEDMCYQAHRNLVQFDSYQWYLQLRGLADRIESCYLGYHGGWYTIPVYNYDGEFETAVFRAAAHVQAATGMRYYCPKKQPMMYVPDWQLLKSSDYIVVCYGIFDAITLTSLRIPAVTNTFGKDTFQAEWLDEYRKPVYVLPDKGEEYSAYKLSRQFGWRSVQPNSVLKLAYPNRYKDPNDYLSDGKRKELEIELHNLLRR